MIYDLTLPMHSGMDIYEGDPTYLLLSHSIIKDNGYAVSKLGMGTHTGTHVDMPAHFLENAKTVDNFTLDKFIGNCIALPLCIRENELCIKDNDIHLVHEQNIVILYAPCDLQISQSVCDILITKDIKAVGINRPSIDSDGTLHRKFLSSDIVIFENLNFSESLLYKHGTFHGVPLYLENADASPVRAYIIT